MTVISRRFTVFLKGVVFQVYAGKLGECLDHAFGFVPLLFATIFSAASSDSCWDFPAMILFCLCPHDCVIVMVDDFHSPKRPLEHPSQVRTFLCTSASCSAITIPEFDYVNQMIKFRDTALERGIGNVEMSI